MDNTKDGGSVNKPPILGGTNYDYWKAKMVSFLKSTGIKTWKIVIKGWKYHVITSQDGTTSLNPGAEWTDVEDNEALGNSKALNFIFSSVDKNMFRLINTYTKAKYAWEILRTSH